MGMVKQRVLGQSNQKELTQKGTNIKEEAVTMSVAAGAAQRSELERNDPSAASVAWRTAS